MLALGLETIFVSGVGEGDLLAVGGGVREGPLRSLSLILRSGILQITFLLSLDAITGFVGKIVGSVTVDVVFETEDGDLRSGRTTELSGKAPGSVPGSTGVLSR